MVGLCFGCSFVFHAAVVMSMLLTPVPSASAWSPSKNNTQSSDRHVVKVTMMLSPMSFEPKPEGTPDGQAEAEPVEKVPPVPVAVPELPPTPDATTPSTLATTAKPPMPVEPIATEREMRLEPQPIALDVPRTALNDAPLPEFVEPSEQERSDTAEQSDPVQVPDAVAGSALPEVTVAEPTESLPSMPEGTPKQATAEPTETTDEATEASAEQTAEASEADTQEVESPVEEEAEADPAMAYDEESVDRRITFDEQVRPKRSMLSRRLGESGSVRILIEVDAAGKLIRHEVLDDAGFPRLLASALKALEASTFEPAILDEKAVRSTRVIEYRF